MKHTIFRLYYDFEKEEKWLNEMSAKGLVLTDYCWCRYVFEDAPNNEYTYRIELLEHLPSHPESIAYIRFLEENGVEHIASYIRWIYLRKKSSEGSFDIYSDKESKIRHYKRIYLFWSTFMWLELILGMLTLSIEFMEMKSAGSFYAFQANRFAGGFLLILIGLFFFKIGLPIRKKIKILKHEQIIRE